MESDTFREMLKNSLNPEVLNCLSAVREITGFELSDDDQAPFLYFHNFLTNPQPYIVSQWRADKALEKWYLKFANGFLQDVRSTLSCVLYHYERLHSIERSIIQAVEQYNYRDALGNSTIAIGSTPIWDFEYQAFVLAFRRCLDYLTGAIFAYFKDQNHSFRKLGDNLKKVDKSGGIAQALEPLHVHYKPLFAFALSDGDRKSVRDKISHYEYVPIGTINLSQRGFVLAGGGEQLDGFANVLISDVLDSHVTNLRNCLRDMITQFVDAAKLQDK